MPKATAASPAPDRGLDAQQKTLARLVGEEEGLMAEKRAWLADFNDRLKDKRAEIRQLAAEINSGARRLPGI